MRCASAAKTPSPAEPLHRWASHVWPPAVNDGVRLMLTMLAAACLWLPGCAFQQHREQLASTFAATGPSQALALLQSPSSRELYGEQDRLLYFLDAGTLTLMTGDPAEAIRQLEQAEAIMDYGGDVKRTAGDDLAQWLINDTAATYRGEPYESIYLNAIKLCAYLTVPDEQGGQGVISGGATVEARRATAKADLLRRRYLDGRAALDKEASRPTEPGGAHVSGAPAMADATTAGQFIDSPLATYLTTVAFLKSGETDLVPVAARRLQQAVSLQPEIIGNVDPAAFSSLGSLTPGDANVLIVAFSGLAPTKVAQRVGPVPIYTWPLYFELPVLRVTPSRVAAVRATLTPREPSESNPPQVVELNLIENMALVSQENHRRQLPQIYARTLVRASIRSGISFAATEAIRNNTDRGSRRDAATVAAVVAGMAALAATERADTRCWVTLPGQAHVALARMPAGVFDASIQWLDGSGRALDTRQIDGLTAADAPQALATALAFTNR